MRHHEQVPSVSAEICLFPGVALPEGLNAHETFVAAARTLYVANIQWCAPCRGIQWHGRELVIRQLLREGGAMHEPEFTLLRRNCSAQQIIDEYAVRFVYTGEGIDNAPIARDDFVELKRVRVLSMSEGRCTQETCIESWTTLLPAHADR